MKKASCKAPLPAPAEDAPHRQRQVAAYYQHQREEERRRKKRRPPKPFDQCYTTVREIEAVLKLRHPNQQLPDDDAGREYAALMLWYLAHLRHGNIKTEQFLRWWCPWMEPREREHFLQEAARSRPPRLKADIMAIQLGLTYDERQRLGLRLIGSIDVPKEQRERLRRERDREAGRERKRRQRRDKGAKPRDQYLAEALARTKPWEASGVSPRTWFRRRTRGKTATSVAQVRPSASFEKLTDTPVPSSTAPPCKAKPSREKQRQRLRHGSDGLSKRSSEGRAASVYHLTAA